MRRRLIVANLVVVLVVLIALETPLAVIYSGHEHDALYTALQRDAGALAALSGEIIEHPSDHDVNALAKRFSVHSSETVIIVDRSGIELTRPSVASVDAAFRPVLDAARAGHGATGELSGLTYVALPLGVAGESRGAVLVARPDDPIDQRVHQFWLLLLGLGVGVLAVSLVISRRVSRWVVDPLRRLDQQAAALGRGELTARAETGEGPPEVVTLAATFNDMADRLNELVRSQRRFVADASHQLRTPLTALRLRLESLEPDDPATIAATRDAALDEASRLTRLVDGLLSLARAEGRRPDREVIDVQTVMEDRQEAWAPLAVEQRIDLRVETDVAAQLSARLVPGHLEQILDNLIDNAIDAGPPDSVVLLRAVSVGQHIEVHVIDEGRGMSDDERRRAFDPFWQSASSDGHSNGSTGLGLAIAEQLARASQGSIALERSASGGIDAVVRFVANSNIA